MVNHSDTTYILNWLVVVLGVDELGRTKLGSCKATREKKEIKKNGQMESMTA